MTIFTSLTVKLSSLPSVKSPCNSSSNKR
jgi:hypothetical protein